VAPSHKVRNEARDAGKAAAFLLVARFCLLLASLTSDRAALLHCKRPALQVRINGENPAKDFQPCPGILGDVAFPMGE
jgi:biotin carboxylase